MSKQGEFTNEIKIDYVRGAAVKMLARAIIKPGNNGSKENKVRVSNKALQMIAR
jgi:hypothetical protein